MADWAWIALALVAGGFGLLLLPPVRRWLRAFNAQPFVTHEFWSALPDEPGWEEDLGSDGERRCARSFRVDDHLLLADAQHGATRPPEA